VALSQALHLRRSSFRRFGVIPRQAQLTRQSPVWHFSLATLILRAIPQIRSAAA
jgi:hypothetical protein